MLGKLIFVAIIIPLNFFIIYIYLKFYKMGMRLFNYVMIIEAHKNAFWIKSLIRFVTLISILQAFESNVYFIVTSVYKILNEDCPWEFEMYVRMHNYLVYQTFAPIQALFLLFLVNYFT